MSACVDSKRQSWTSVWFYFWRFHDHTSKQHIRFRPRSVLISLTVYNLTLVYFQQCDHHLTCLDGHVIMVCIASGCVCVCVCVNLLSWSLPHFSITIGPFAISNTSHCSIVVWSRVSCKGMPILSCPAWSTTNTSILTGWPRPRPSHSCVHI
jgi:hypothetical protein